MSDRLPLDSPRWDQLNTFGADARDVPELIRQVQRERRFGRNTAFTKLVDRIFQQFSVREALYPTIPYLVDLGKQLSDDEASELWKWIGTAVACAAVSEHGVPPEFAEAYTEALATAEARCVSTLLKGEREAFDAYELGVAAVALAGHRIGLLVMDNFSPEDDAETTAICPVCGKEIRIAVFDEGLVVEDQDFEGYPSAPQPPRAFNEASVADAPSRNPNPWRQVADALSANVDALDSPPLPASHISTAFRVASFGVSPGVAAGPVFSLLGCLIARNGEREPARRYFHAWDDLECPFCRAQFRFADAWWGMKRRR
jgi:hypothetical protein